MMKSFYLAPVSYYTRLAQQGGTAIDPDDIYCKQTLRNRCYIASPNGPLALTIPVVKFVPYRTLTRDIRISDHGNWRHLHWQALTSSYRRTPFFEFYADDFAPFYERKWEFLADYNQALQELVCGLVFGEDGKPDDAPHADTDSPAPGPQTDFRPVPYYQMFSDRHGFMPDLSIVDLLFNMGPESILILHA